MTDAAKVRAARALASVATFCVIAVVLLGGSVGDEGATSASAAPGDRSRPKRWERRHRCGRIDLRPAIRIRRVTRIRTAGADSDPDMIADGAVPGVAVLPPER